MDDMDEIVQEFLIESRENLTQLDQDLVHLEADPGSRDLLGSVFRTIHTIKGTSGFLALPRLEALTHAGENLLARLRDGEMTMTPPVADVLLAMVDKVGELLTHIEDHGTEGNVEVDPTVAAITAILEGTTVETPVVEPVVDEAAALEAVLESLAPAVSTPPALSSQPETSPPVVEAVVETPVEPENPTAAVEVVKDPHKRTVSDSSVRVDVDLLDSLMRLVGELVLSRNQIVAHANTHRDTDAISASQRLNLITTELQEGVLKTRMQTIDRLWSKLPRIVRDLGAQVGKQVELEMTGGDTELDRSLLEAVKDPLTHLVRNAVDHGIENPTDRAAAGKPAAGRLMLSAFHEGGQVVVEVRDDGAGINPDRVAAKALERGLRTPEEIDHLTPAEVLQLIFTPGFSTAAAVTNVSGRGVGMDVVRTNIEAIGGTVEMDSVPGQGTTCRLRIPLTLAILPALTIECSGDRYALPQVNLLELVSLTGENSTHIDTINGAPVYRLRGDLLPLVDLAEVLATATPDTLATQRVLSVLSADHRRFGLIVDRVLSTEEIVVKPLSSHLTALGVYSGATILGDGGVALLLDVAAIARRSLGTETTGCHDRRATVVAEHEIEQVLLAGVGTRQVAVPLAFVTRIEQIASTTIEVVGSREVLQYRGDILPLLRLDTWLGVHGTRTVDDLLVLVYTSGLRSVAIAVDEVLDIVALDIDTSSELSDRGLIGSAAIAGKVTELLDVRAAILAADPHFFDTEENR